MLDLNNINDKETFGERIRSARKRKNISQLELSSILGCNRSTISQWERGENTIEIPTLCKLCNALDIDIFYLFGEIEEDNLNIHNMRKYTGLTEEAISTLYEWNNCNDQRKRWSSIMSKVIDDPRLHDIMLYLCSAKYIFDNLSSSDFGSNSIMSTSQSEIVAFLWYISKSFSDIAEDIIQSKN